MQRRDFLNRMTGLTTGALLGHSIWWPLSARALLSPGTTSPGRILVLVVLQGGNDGLNTLIPYADPLYYAKRPVLSIPAAQVLTLQGGVGLHPALAPLLDHWNAGRLAVVRDVGYPAMSLSHFRATDILFSGTSATDVLSTGWLARYLEATHPDFPATLPPGPMAVQQGFSAGLVLQGDRGVTGVVVDNPSTFYSLVNGNYVGSGSDAVPETRGGNELEYVRGIDEASFAYAGVIQSAATAGENRVTYANSSIARQLATVARLIDGQMDTPVYLTGMGGFDTHATQLNNHAALLAELADGLDTFMDDLEQMGRRQDVVVLTVSEFGRRVGENGSAGTDHGTAAPWFVLGGGISGGLVGAASDLAALDGSGNLAMQHDYRSVYATLLRGWLGADPALAQALLGGDFPLLGFLPATAVPEEGGRPGGAARLEPPFPNPARGPRTLRFSLAQPGPAEVSAFDASGAARGAHRERGFRGRSARVALGRRRAGARRLFRRARSGGNAADPEARRPVAGPGSAAADPAGGRKAPRAGRGALPTPVFLAPGAEGRLLLMGPRRRRVVFPTRRRTACHPRPELDPRMPADTPEVHAVTRLLGEARAGSDTALERLLQILYAELHGIAERHMRGERRNHTLQPTALLHEAVLKLLGRTRLEFDDRNHFLRSASQAMRRVLVDHARARNALKRGGGLAVTLDESVEGRGADVVDMLVLDQALDRLAAAEPRWAHVVELRFFAGLEIAEVAEVLAISPATVKRDWQFARAWLSRELGDAPLPGGGAA